MHRSHCYIFRFTHIALLLCFLFFCRLLNGTLVQCCAGSKPRQGSGPVVFNIDNVVVESEEVFICTEDPQVSSLMPTDVIKRY